MSSSIAIRFEQRNDHARPIDTCHTTTYHNRRRNIFRIAQMNEIQFLKVPNASILRNIINTRSASPAWNIKKRKKISNETKNSMIIEPELPNRERSWMLHEQHADRAMQAIRSTIYIYIYCIVCLYRLFYKIQVSLILWVTQIASAILPSRAAITAKCVTNLR